MRNKRIVIRALTRAFYAGGAVFLISGLLLSAISFPVVAAGDSTLSARQPFSLFGQPGLQSNDPAAEAVAAQVTYTPIGTGPSSLVFASNCNCSCAEVKADVCNVGGPMQGPVAWNLYYSLDGNPSQGAVVDTGQVNPLGYGQCTTLTYGSRQPGNYSYQLVQEASHTGPDLLWSNTCMVNGSCFPTETPSVPTVTNTPVLPIVTDTAVAPTETRAPLTYNLSAVCDYPSSNFLLWKVTNTSGAAVDYTWRVSGTDENGSGRIEANAEDYFTTSPGDKLVHLFVNNELVDSQPSEGPCKQDLLLSYTCTPNGLDWYIRNPNDFNVTISWTVDGTPSGSSVLPANETLLIASTSAGAHSVEVQWADTRPVTHRVTMASDAASCAPGLTVTPPTPTFTATVTDTPTLPTLTFTPTSTFTQVPPTLTFTPTSTFTQVSPTLTFTPTNTGTLPAPTNTFTPTSTFTQVPPTLTFTPTRTFTLVPTQSSTPEQGPTPVRPSLTPTLTFTLQPTQTFTQVPTRTFTLAPSLTPAQATTPIFPATFTATFQPAATNTTAPSATTTPSATPIVTLPPPAQVSTPVIIPVTGVDMLAPARTAGMLGQLFMNIGLVLFALALALTGASWQMKD